MQVDRSKLGKVAGLALSLASAFFGSGCGTHRSNTAEAEGQAIRAQEDADNARGTSAERVMRGRANVAARRARIEEEGAAGAGYSK